MNPLPFLVILFLGLVGYLIDGWHAAILGVTIAIGLIILCNLFDK